MNFFHFDYFISLNFGMPRVQITEHLSTLINKQRQQGRSIREISENLQISRSAVHSHIRKQRNPQPRAVQTRGRPRKTNKSLDHQIFLSAKRARFSPSRRLASDFQVSHQTIQRRLKERKLKSCIAHVDALTGRQKRARLAWCRAHRARNFQEWIFSDESSFELAELSLPRRQFVHRTTREKHRKCCIESGGVQTRVNIMAWGAISSRGSVCLSLVQGHIRAADYVEVLRENLLPYLDEIPLNRLSHTVFQQDNAPPHRALLTRNFLAREGIDVTEWPPFSPDINPIENVWSILKKHIQKNRPVTVQQLREQILAGWNAVVTPELCANLYNSLPTRIEEIITKRGLR